MKKSEITVEVYEVGKWIVYIEENEKTYEGYIRHKECGLSELMFGTMKDSTSKEDFLDLVIVNLTDYVNGYIEDYIIDVDMLGRPMPKEVK